MQPEIINYLKGLRHVVLEEVVMTLVELPTLVTLPIWLPEKVTCVVRYLAMKAVIFLDTFVFEFTVKTDATVLSLIINIDPSSLFDQA